MQIQQTFLRWMVELMLHKRRATQRCVVWMSVHALQISLWDMVNHVNAMECRMHANRCASAGWHSSTVS